MRQKLFDFVTSWLAWLLRIERCCDCGCRECDTELFIPSTLPTKPAFFKIDERLPEGYIYFMPPGWDDEPVSPIESAMITNLSLPKV